MLIRIDDRVSAKLVEDREDLIKEMSRSTRMYSWVKGEDIGVLLDGFATENRRATFADLINWSKATYLDRVKTYNSQGKWTNFHWETEEETRQFDRRDARQVDRPRASAQTVEAVQAVRRKDKPEDNAAPEGGKPSQSQPRTDLKKVAEPGEEPAEEGKVPDKKELQELTKVASPFG